MSLYLGVWFILGIIRNSYFNLPERLYFSVYILSLLALWGLGLKRRIFCRIFWRLLFFVHVLLFILCLIYGVEYDVPLLWCAILSIIETMILILHWIGLFIYAFRSKHIWQGQDHKPITTIVMYPRDRKSGRMGLLERCSQLLKLLIPVSLIILCLTFAPMIILNNRVCYPEGNLPRFIEHMFKYRRTTIPQLKEFELLFPNHLYVFDYNDTNFIIDPNEGIHHPDPNSPVRWRLSAGLHRRYLVVMETDIISAKMDPETEEIISPGSHDEPVFSLWEVRSVSICPRYVLFRWRNPWTIPTVRWPGKYDFVPTCPKFVMFSERYAYTDRVKLKTLTADEWEKLVQAEGDFSVLGIELKKNDPVRNFKKACWNNE